VLFNGTYYRVLVSHMCLHMCGIGLWEFLTAELPCQPFPTACAQIVILENATDDEKEKLLIDYDDCMPFCDFHFHEYRTCLHEDARAGAVFAASMKVEFDWPNQMWTFFVIAMSHLVSLPILLLFIRSSFYDRVTVQLITYLISSMLFGASLTLLVQS
jgi:hypothetical protein